MHVRFSLLCYSCCANQMRPGGAAAVASASAAVGSQGRCAGRDNLPASCVLAPLPRPFRSSPPHIRGSTTTARSYGRPSCGTHQDLQTINEDGRHMTGRGAGAGAGSGFACETMGLPTRVHLFVFFTNPADHRKQNSGRNSAENRIFRTEGEFKFKKRNSGNSGRNSATFRRNSATFRRNSGLSGGKCHFLTTNAPNI